ncbi:MAG: SUMF1/EgtB/PvdO family nonheme iron enzyme [Anaerolineae bacterium]|nr:SUMF1/EgtB/PvdO family nonheme iron enzyme [Anaerolineae bacterium]
MTAIQHQHHFEDLSPDDFERLIYWIIKRSGEFDEVQWYGGPGDRGRDVVAYKHTSAGREKWYIQAKRYQRIAFGTLRDELDKLAEHSQTEPDFSPDVIVFATACAVPPQAKDQAKAHAQALGLPKPYYWGRLELDERLKAQSQTENEFFGNLAPLLIPPFNLPAALPDFIGREAQIASIRDYLGEEGSMAICVIAGMGGTGKTALALHVAHQLAAQGRFPHAQLYLDLKGAAHNPTNPAAALNTLLTALHGPDPQRPTELDALTGLWHSALYGKRALLLLDNAACASQVRPLLPGSSTCTVLITSRRRFTLPGVSRLDLDCLNPSDARILLQKLAPRLSNVEADRIAKQCGCLPLALRIAGNYLALNNDCTPAEYVARLNNEHRRLSLLRDPGDSNLDVAITLSLSIAQLDDETRRAWEILTLFPAPFDLSTATVLWAQKTTIPQTVVVPLDEEETLEKLQSLRERSLISYDSKNHHYYLHDLLRLTGAEQHEPIRNGLTRSLVDILDQNPPVTSIATRIKVGDILGQLGDPRFTSNYLLPEFMLIPARIFWMGSSEAEIGQLMQERGGCLQMEEMHKHRIELASFAMACYPTTNAMFQCFVNAGGYAEKSWWKEAINAGLWAAGKIEDAWGNTRDQPVFWDNAHYNRPNQPVVGITWYEAVAYCHWLTRNLNDGNTYCLPTEAQWECAARGIRHYCYPWGSEWMPGRANTYELGLGRATPVGIFADCMSSEEILDLSGNVWEWCTDWYSHDTYDLRANCVTQNPVGPSSGTCKVLRGGSWAEHRDSARCASRFWVRPDDRTEDIGFRIARDGIL